MEKETEIPPAPKGQTMFVVTWIDPTTNEAHEFVSDRLEAIYAKVNSLNNEGPIGSFHIKRFKEFNMTMTDGRH